MNKTGLVIRLAIVVIFAAAVVGFLSTQIFYRIIYLNELDMSKQKIAQLHDTVSSTVSIATYLADQELVTEVVNGLVSNDIVKSVEIKASDLVVSSTNHINSVDSIEFILFSPFEAERSVGTLTISPNLLHITNRAKEISFDNSLAIFVQASIVTLIVIVVAYVEITKPLLGIEKRLHTLVPGTHERLKIPKYHTQSELGNLVVDINLLLDKTEYQFEKERNLRAEVERLSQHFKTLFENSTSPIVLTEPKGNILLYNQAFSILLNRINIPLKKSYGPYLRELFVESHQFDNVVEIAFGNEEIASGEFKLLNMANQEAIWMQTIVTSSISDDYREHYQIALHDISKRKLQLETLDKKASTDELTQLLNRRGAEQKINSLIQSKTPFSLILLDLNKFKPVNDIHGHEVGDEVLIHVASQLTKGLRRRDILSRWGGDEFVIVLPNILSSALSELTSKIKEHIETPLYIKKLDISLSVSASMGGAIFPDDHVSLKMLVESADKAMYIAKEQQHVNADAFFSLYQDLQHQSSTL